MCHPDREPKIAVPIDERYELLVNKTPNYADAYRFAVTRAIEGGMDLETADTDGYHPAAEIVKLAMGGDFAGARLKLVELTRVYGIPESDFLRFANEALNSLEVPDMAKAISILAEYDFRLVQGSQPELQLTAMLAQLSALKRKE